MTQEKKHSETGQDCPEGYKSCDGYRIPKEWHIVRFDSLFSRVTRKNDENNQNVLTISAQQGLISQAKTRQDTPSCTGVIFLITRVIRLGMPMVRSSGWMRMRKASYLRYIFVLRPGRG